MWQATLQKAWAAGLLLLSLALLTADVFVAAPKAETAQCSTEQSPALRAVSAEYQTKQDSKRQRSGRSSGFFLTLESVSLSAAVRCARDVLKEQGWKVVDLKSAKSQIRAFRHLGRDDLLRVAHTSLATSEVRWSQGRADLRLNLEEASSGSTRIDLSLRILAYAETSLPLLRPTNWFPLPSRGILESELLAALKEDCASQR
jgi:hypothetical protein